MSDWNLYLERKLGLRLGLEASRLADAIARETLGWNTRSRAVSQHVLREWAGLHGMSFERAREELIQAGLIHLTRGDGGRGNRDHYSLLLEEETPAPERAIGTEPAAETPAQTPAQAPAPQRVQKGEGVKGSIDGTDLPQPRRSGAAASIDMPLDDDVVDALDDLTRTIDDTSPATWEQLASDFSTLPAHEIRDVAEEIDLRRDGYAGYPPIDDPLAYARASLHSRLKAELRRRNHRKKSAKGDRE